MPRWPMFWTWPPVQPTNKRRVTFTFKAKIASDVARAGIEPATFRFSDGLVLGLNLFALVKLDSRPAFRRVRSVGPARWPHLGPIR